MMTSVKVKKIVNTVLSPISNISKTITSLLSKTFSLTESDLQDGDEETIYANMTGSMFTSTPNHSADTINIHCNTDSVIMSEDDKDGKCEISVKS